MIACYLELYEEGEVEHINGVWPNSKHSQLVGSYNLNNAHRKQNAHVQKTALYIPNHAVTLRPFKSEQDGMG